MIVDGRTIHGRFEESSRGSRCEKHLGALRKKKAIDLESIGSRPNNLLLEFLKCRNKHQKSKNGGENNDTNGPCGAIEKAHAGCHASVMGTGSFGGRRHCGNELGEWLGCRTSEDAP
mmetsp:Transcript_16461/g.33832  ORF Transcript_16461/g.33832 Transcript_16461/m.33832 type:complete len:117 (-) Transcript_16461:1228-1578(-)